MNTVTQAPSGAVWRRRLRRLRARVVTATALIWLRVSFAVLQVVAPQRAYQRALDVWCTLPPGSARRHDSRPAAGEILRLAAPRGGDVVIEVWGEGPPVLLVHGWGGWRGQLGTFVTPLVAAGFQVLAIDAPAHGDAAPGMFGPRRGTLVEIVDAIEVVRERFGPMAGVVAHSLGTTATGMALQSGLGADRVVLVAPNPGIGPLLEKFSRILWLNPRTTAGLREALEDLVQAPISTVDLVTIGAAGNLPEALVVHDRSDRETAHQIGIEVARAWPGAEMLSTEGLGHVRILTDAAVVTAAVEHLSARN